MSGVNSDGRNEELDKGIDNPAMTEDDVKYRRPDLVISVQPTSHSTRAELPVSTINWQSTPRGQFIPTHGLDFLIGVNSLLIQQTVELTDLTSNIESENRYIVRVPNGESLYIASETSSSKQRCLCGTGRGFTMRLHDNTRQEAMVMQRRLAAASCCFPCRLQEMKVVTPPGDYVGRIQQRWTLMVPFYLVRDANDDVMFVIEGPAALLKKSLLLSEFKIMTGDSLREAGTITHSWDRSLVSFVTTVNFPETVAQPKHKALLLAAAFLLEQKNSKTVGRIQQRWTLMVPFYLVRDANDDVMFVIEGPAALLKKSLLLSEFKIMTGDSLREAGTITHSWDRSLVSFVTTVNFPETVAQPKHKALLLAAAFLLEYTYFEISKTKCIPCCCFS